MPNVDETMPRKRRTLRWWLIGGIVAAFVAALLWIRLDDDLARQQQVMRTVLVTIIGTSLLLLWVVCVSGFRWYVRLAIVLGFGVALASAPLLLRVEGVSGDLVPIVKWGWSSAPEDLLPGELDADPDAIDTTVAMPGLADYPQFLGPGRNGIVGGVALARDWSDRPPRELWRQPIGAGWSAFAVAGRRAVTQEQRGSDEVVSCHDVGTGRLLWAHRDAELYDDTVAGDGPRATPTIDGDRVYTVGSTGLLNCLELRTGREVWSVDLLDDSGGRQLEWGISWSPLIVDGRVVVNPGGTGDRSVIAYDAVTGERAWAAGSDSASYASPAIGEVVGRSQVLMVNQYSVSGHDATDGAMLWEFDWPGRMPKVAQPVPLSADRVLVSAGYGIGSVMLRLLEDDDGGLAAETVWTSRRLKAKFANVVCRDGHVYGLDDGILTCLDLESGQRRWKDGRYGHGQIILAGDLLIIQAESGELFLVEAVPDEHRELGSYAALDSKTWNNAALAGRYLLVRNDREAVCLELPVLEP